MKKTYVIQWKSKVNGRAGRGTKVFEIDEATQLVDELNREYPQIQHEVVDAERVREETAPLFSPAPVFSVA
jgi:hypothetical protein